MDGRGAAHLSGNPFAERLRQSGLRATRPRLLVLELIERSGGHWSADSLADELRRRGERISRASVYNVLSSLTECGLVARAEAGPGCALYERADQARHHHFVCRCCDTVVDVPRAAGALSPARLRLPGARVEEAQVVFRGLCPDCNRRARRGRPERKFA